MDSSISQKDLREELKLFLQFGREKVVSHQAFSLFDIDGDGIITISELKRMMKKVGGSMTEEEAERLIELADQDGNKGLDYSEFTKVWAAVKGNIYEESFIREEFRKIDKDGSGFIDKEEMLNKMQTGQGFADGLQISEAQKCIDELDVDKDGRVSYPEFLLVYKYKLNG